ncbi:3-deoxy-7-phosphoheptulonate synthase [Amycolatopsis sp. NPDC005961]|uniref:3-deoxy-7-phosphoheptulonate synthase n=1 Tax=Amycolatopsis sp. NPDC005961 TaxID=3156720 RepID=UPI0033E55BC8
MESYPEFASPAAVPPATRMLLNNDGSTTVLLQSLLGSSLAAEVLPEVAVASVKPSAQLAAVFGRESADELGVRRSRLRDEAGAVVSENAITFLDRDRGHLMPSGKTPFGLHTRCLGLYERRRLLVAGVTTGRFGLLPAGSPGRVYEIEFSNRAKVLVHEVFNPRFVATDAPGRRPVERHTMTDFTPVVPGEHHQPQWPLASERRRVRRVLTRVAPLVSAADCRRLRGALGQPGFLLHAGDCAETFRENTPRSVMNRAALLRAMAGRIERASGREVVTVGRIAGQYAKPRSAAVERRDELVLPSYLGDAVNGSEFSARSRTPDPRNLIRAYQESAKTLSFLAGSGVATSHEALLLDYERPLARYSPDDGRWYGLSAHLLWIGERTRSLTGPHVELAAGIANPVAVKIGPKAGPDELLGLHDALNPHNEPGRLTFIFRMGHAQAYDRARALLSAAAAEGLADRFVSDPMHGNTITTAAGVKTRWLPEIEAELRAFFAACRDTGTSPGGVHLELSGDLVTECVTGELDDGYLATAYRSACDPRLNPEQSLWVADVVGELLARTSAAASPEPVLATA